MSKNMLLSDLIAIIQQKFATGVPNGWLLGWSQKRLEVELAQAVRPLVITNWTTFDYAFCNHFEVTLNRENSGSCFVLTVRISFVCDLFCLHWTKYDQAEKEGVVVKMADVSHAKGLEKAICTLIERQGFEQIKDEWLKELVPGVKLELSRDEDVTVSKCLFEDYDG